uniref:Formin-binding protein 4-like n=1 Tax=Diabrotica virgifera virgifera TaxID=50390 RepID=A0A6P7FVU4_DIAVI
MEYKVDDFFNEINEIAPPPLKEAQDEDWKQCFDKLTGYPYYWNKKTDEVTWTVPPGFKTSEEKTPSKPQKKLPPRLPPKVSQPKSLYIPQRSTVFPAVASSLVPKESVKVYSVAEATSAKKRPVATKKDSQKRRYPKDDQSDDEKIVLISSYGSGSDSEEEAPVPKRNKPEPPPPKQRESSVSDDDDDLDILAKIQKRAQELRELGGDIPAEVKSVVESAKNEIQSTPHEHREVPIGPSLPEYSRKDTSTSHKKITGIGTSLPEYSKRDISTSNRKVGVAPMSPSLPEYSKIDTSTSNRKVGVVPMGPSLPPLPEYSKKDTSTSNLSRVGVVPIGPSLPSLPEYSKKDTFTSKKRVTTGPSLVASYLSDSDSDEDNEEIKNIPQVKQELPVAHSTLFPVTKPVSINDFITPKPPEVATSTSPKTAATPQPFDTKLFMRKKKLSVPVVTVAKKSGDDEERRTGFGFEENVATSERANDNLYPGFKKGGVAFVKSDVLLPSFTRNEESNGKEEDDLIDREGIDNTYSNLKDKLTFLNEGRPSISSVQVMLVQAETLVVAMNDGALKRSYLKKWLDDTCSELKKLEKEAAPTGWMLQWDRTHRRYFYQNRFSGTSQWEYPQPDMNTSDVAMDISTTPPPPHEIESPPPEEVLPPLPPKIRSPSPPPPPVISCVEYEEVVVHTVPLPVPASPVTVTPQLTYNGQPHPPGVDISELTPIKPTINPQPPDLDSALDSFYSDIAAITSSPKPPPQQEEENISPVEVPIETVKKKKKPKVKLAQGLTMKKKGVSQLVEKWKNVQQEYNN